VCGDVCVCVGVNVCVGVHVCVCEVHVCGVHVCGWVYVFGVWVACMCSSVACVCMGGWVVQVVGGGCVWVGVCGWEGGGVCVGGRVEVYVWGGGCKLCSAIIPIPLCAILLSYFSCHWVDSQCTHTPGKPLNRDQKLCCDRHSQWHRLHSNVGRGDGDPPCRQVCGDHQCTVRLG